MTNFGIPYGGRRAISTALHNLPARQRIPAGAEVPQGPFNLKQDVATPDSGTLQAAGSAAAASQSLTISAEIEPGQGAQFKIITCGQPQKESATSIKVPLIFQINELNKECLINIIISFDNFTMREPR